MARTKKHKMETAKMCESEESVSIPKSKLDGLRAALQAAQSDFDSICDDVIAFAGQLQARGFYSTAHEMKREILQNCVHAPDYYELRAAIEHIEDIANQAIGDTSGSLVAVGVIAAAARKALKVKDTEPTP